MGDVAGKHRGTAAVAADEGHGMDIGETGARFSYHHPYGVEETYAAQGDIAAAVADDDGRYSPDLSFELDAVADDDEVVIHP